MPLLQSRSWKSIKCFHNVVGKHKVFKAVWPWDIMEMSWLTSTLTYIIIVTFFSIVCVLLRTSVCLLMHIQIGRTDFLRLWKVKHHVYTLPRKWFFLWIILIGWFFSWAMWLVWHTCSVTWPYRILAMTTPCFMHLIGWRKHALPWQWHFLDFDWLTLLWQCLCRNLFTVVQNLLYHNCLFYSYKFSAEKW